MVYFTVPYFLFSSLHVDAYAFQVDYHRSSSPSEHFPRFSTVVFAKCAPKDKMAEYELSSRSQTNNFSLTWATKTNIILEVFKIS